MVVLMGSQIISGLDLLDDPFRGFLLVQFELFEQLWVFLQHLVKFLLDRLLHGKAD